MTDKAMNLGCEVEDLSAGHVSHHCWTFRCLVLVGQARSESQVKVEENNIEEIS